MNAPKKKNPHAVALGRKGGKIGGKSTTPKGLQLKTPEERKAIHARGIETRKKNLAKKIKTSIDIKAV